jgi:hypothetical protein
MDAAVVFTLAAVVLIILALVVYLLAVIAVLRRITAGLDRVIASVGEILRKTEPVGETVGAINSDLAAGTELLDGLLAKKAGPEDGPGLVESLFPGAGVAMLEREGRPGAVKNIDVVYTRGAVQLARLGRESPLGAGGEAGPALRDPAYSSAAARALYSNPSGPRPGGKTRPGSPTIGSDAPAFYGSPPGGYGSVAEPESGPTVDRDAGDAADATADQPPAAKRWAKEEVETKDIGLGPRPSDEQSAE